MNRSSRYANLLPRFSLLAGLALGLPAAAGIDAVLESPIEVGGFLTGIGFDGQGHALAVWSGPCQAAVVSTSGDNGATWATPRLLFEDEAPSLALGFDVAHGDGTWIVVWQARDWIGGLPSGTYRILYSRSVDQGATWTPAEALSANLPKSEFPSVATDGLGRWAVVWRTDIRVMYAHSADDGVSWTDPQRIGSSGTPIEFEIRAHVAADGIGNWVVVWPESVASFQWDVRYARSTDGGATWSEPSFIDDSIDGNDHPAIAADGLGNWIAVWDTRDADPAWNDLDVVSSRSTDGGQTWSAAVPVNAQSQTDGHSMDDELPKVAADGHGNWLVAWRSNPHQSIGSIDVVGSRSTDMGTTWSEPGPLHAGSAIEDDLWHELITDRHGNWLLSWFSTGFQVQQGQLLAPFRLHFAQTCASDLDGDGYGLAGEAGCPLGTQLDCDDTNVRVTPRATALCDTSNNDCASPAWPSLADTNESDDDGDGLSECAGDCDDGLAEVWAPPGALALVMGEGAFGTTVVTWTVAGDSGGSPGALRYDTFRNSTPQQNSCWTGWSCLEEDGADAITVDPDAGPGPGEAFFYLVRAENPCSTEVPPFAACP